MQLNEIFQVATHNNVRILQNERCINDISNSCLRLNMIIAEYEV